MRSIVRGPLRLALLALLLTGCGVGSTVVPGFAIVSVGPEGGVVEAGDVFLFIPAGSLPGPTAVGILPQADPLPIDPGNDPCLIDFLGPIWCCGPLGQVLDPPGTIRLEYDESLIPVGASESDLVLLLWDDAAQVLRPVTQGVVHDTVENFFETVFYDELGHLAVGVRTCDDERFLFLGAFESELRVLPLGREEPPLEGLYLAQTDLVGPPIFFDTGGLPGPFVASPAGDRVLWLASDPESETSLLRSRLLDGSGSPVDLTPGRELFSEPILFGWRVASPEAFFHEYLYSPVLTAPTPLGDGSLEDGPATSVVPGDGSLPPAIRYPIGGFFFRYPVDFRQSDDGSHWMIRIVEFGNGILEWIDIVRASDGALLSSAALPLEPGDHMPRFLPGTDDAYGIDTDGTTVYRFAPDGTRLADLFAIAPSDGTLLDFVVNPDGSRCAWIVRSEAASALERVVEGDTLFVGTLSGGPSASNFLGGPYPPAELNFHPDGERLFVDFVPGIRFYDADDASAGAVLPVAQMGDIDVSRLGGRLLLNARSMLGEEVRSATAGRIPDGLYLADPDGSNLIPVDTLGLPVQAARWVFSWRTTPGMFYEDRVR